MQVCYLFIFLFVYFFSGDIVSVFAEVCNCSSKSMRPKFCLQRKIVYCVFKTTKTKKKTLFKSVGDTIGPNTEVTVSCNILIPPSAIYSINNCDIISVEYYLKVSYKKESYGSLKENVLVVLDS